jgi:hypothetical protein
MYSRVLSRFCFVMDEASKPVAESLSRKVELQDLGYGLNNFIFSTTRLYIAPLESMLATPLRINFTPAALLQDGTRRTS